MTEFYMGQVMMTGFGFAPNKFAQCDGAYMSVAQNQALFSLLGSGLVDQSQKMTVAARAMADKKTVGHLS